MHIRIENVKLVMSLRLAAGGAAPAEAGGKPLRCGNEVKSEGAYSKEEGKLRASQEYKAGGGS